MNKAMCICACTPPALLSHNIHILSLSFFSATTAKRVVEHKGDTTEIVVKWIFLSLEFGVLGTRMPQD